MFFFMESIIFIGFEVLTPVTVKRTVFWVATLRRLAEVHR
jgi:hypothetical protein